MKPKMLLVGGFSWSATSPLVYTLQRNAKYAHFGYTKQFKYLGPDRYPSYQGNPKSSRILTNIYDQVRNNTWENYMSYEPSTHRMNLTVDLQPLHDFPISHFDNLMTGERTERKQLDFFHALHDHVVTKGYKSAGDCYLGYKSHRRDLEEFFALLKSEFDVRFLLIARDPVRRAYSQYLYRQEKKKAGEADGLLTPDGTQTNNTGLGEIINNQFQSFGFSGPIEINFTNYIKKIKRIYEVFGKDNVHVAVMEELWEDDGTAKKVLSQFLDHPIDNLWKNLYSPDKGHFVEFDRDVPCQAYGQNMELTKETYIKLKEQYQKIYDDWKDYYGSLPMNWGEPLDYKFDYWHI